MFFKILQYVQNLKKKNFLWLEIFDEIDVLFLI